MRIVTVNAHYQDGLGYQDYYLCREFMKMGHEVVQIASDRHFPFPNYESTVQPVIGPRIIGAGLFKSEFGMDIHRLPAGVILLRKVTMIGLQKKLAELKPDLIFCHGIFNAYSYRVALYADKNKVPVIYDDHTTSNYRNNSRHVLLIYKLFRRLATPLITKTALKIVAISDSVIHYLKKDLGFTQKIENISLGTDTEIFYPSKTERTETRKQLGIGTHTILITYTGKIYKDKLPEQIPAALERIDLKGKKIVLLFIGPVAAGYQKDFELLLTNQKVKTIYQAGVPPQELRKYYNASDIACWPAHATGSTVDASACGCPVICNKMMSERYSHGNGIGVEEGNTQQLKEALEQLIFNDALREKMGKAGINYVQKKLSWNVIAQQFLS